MEHLLLSREHGQARRNRSLSTETSVLLPSCFEHELAPPGDDRGRSERMDWTCCEVPPRGDPSGLLGAAPCGSRGLTT
jgi:hypothetical protein